MSETSLHTQKLGPGLTATCPSRAYLRGEKELPFPNIWGFLVTNSLCLNKRTEIELKCKTDKHMGKTIKSLNKTICMKKNLLYFLPTRLVIKNTQDMEALCDRTKEAFSIISIARARLSGEYETYYALYTNLDELVIFSDSITILQCIELTTLANWKSLAFA